MKKPAIVKAILGQLFPQHWNLNIANIFNGHGHYEKALQYYRTTDFL